MGALALGAWVAAVLACAPACGGDDDGAGAGGEGSAGARECEPATSFSCVGSNGCAGRQLCNPDGTWGYCSCGGGGARPSAGGTGQGETAGDGAQGEAGAGVAGSGEGGGGAEGGGGEAGSGGGEGGGGEAGSGASGEGGAGQGAQDPERCGNGEDDDGDGDVDCADDDCGERSCEREAPDGWLGPAVIFAEAPPGACPSSFADELVRAGLDVSAEDAECDTCSCTPSEPGCAPFLDFSVGAETECGGVACTASVSASCSSLTSSCLTDVATAYLETQLPGGLAGCAPSAQTPVLPEPEWSEPMLACAAEGLVRGGCASGRLCAPPLPDGAALCILREGERTCPSGPYSERTVYYTDVQDTRTCSSCGCDHDCDYAWRIYDAADADCATPLLTLGAEGQCAQVTPTAGAIRVGVVIDGTGACAASGGEPQGAVSPAEPVTACCAP